MVKPKTTKLNRRTKYFPNHSDTIFSFSLLIASFVFGMLFRLWGAERPFWFDELFSVVISSQQLLDIPEFHVNYDIHPPLFSIFLHIWNIITGDSHSERILRLLSVFFSLGACIGLSWTAYEWKGRRFATTVAIISLLNPTVIIVATEARPYALISMFSALAMVPFFRMLSGNIEKKNIMLLAVLLLACIFTQYIGLIFTFGVFITGFLVVRERKIRRALFGCALIIVAVFLLWSPFFFKQMAFENLLFFDSHGALFRIGIAEFLVKVISFYAASSGGSGRFFGLLYSSALLFALVSMSYHLLFRDSKQNSKPKELATLLLWLVGPIIYMATIAVLNGRLNSATYLVGFGQISVFILALYLHRLSIYFKRYCNIALLAVVVLSAAASWGKVTNTQRHEDWPAAAHYFNRTISKQDTFIFSNGITKYMLAWYAPNAHYGLGNYIYTCSRLQDIPIKEIQKLCDKNRSIWVLDSYAGASGRKVSDVLLKCGFTLTKHKEVGPVDFSLWRKTM